MTELSLKKQTRQKGAFKEVVAKLSRGLMLPIAMLPIAGLFLGLGSTITNLSTSQAMLIFGKIFQTPGNIIFSSLPVLFAIAIAISFTKDSGTAGLSAMVGWLIFNAIQLAFIIEPKTGSVSQAHDYYHFLWYSFKADYDPSTREVVSQQFNSIFTSNLGINSLNTSVFGGICVGGVTAYLFNRFRDIRLPTILGFFSGVRFIPIICFICCLVLGILFSMVWPIIGMGLYYFGNYLGNCPYGFNAFVFGLVERSLVPFGLHHAFYAPLWYTSAGGQFVVNSNAMLDGYQIVNSDGQALKWSDLISLGSGVNATSVISGDQNLWMFVRNYLCGIEVTNTAGTHMTISLSNYYRLLNGNSVSGSPGQYMQGKYPFMIFGLPAAALAMIYVVPKNTDNRKQSIAIIGSAALTCLLTGITEPLEFTFLFLAPWLFWGIHAPLAGLSFWLMSILNAHCGLTFSGGLLDFIIYGVLPDTANQAANCYWIPIIGICLMPIYYFLFQNLILHFDIKTPGRDSEVRMFTKADYKAKDSSEAINISEQKIHTESEILALEIIKAYGGRENIKNVDACITKLRVQIVDASKVDKDMLIKLGAKGIIKPSPQSVYAVFGNEADLIKNKMNDILFPKG